MLEHGIGVYGVRELTVNEQNLRTVGFYEHMGSDAWPKEHVRAHMEAILPQLRHWKRKD